MHKAREQVYTGEIHQRVGDAIMIGWKMADASARKLAVQLTRALRELRETTARDALDLTPQEALAMAGYALRGRRYGAAAVDIVID